MPKNTNIQMIDNLANNFHGYAVLLRKIKQRVLIAQQRAIYAANEEMLRMYWDVGEMLQKSQDADGWGKKTLQRLSVDLKNEYSEIKGFSVRNMQYMIQFFNEYNQEHHLSLPIKHFGMGSQSHTLAASQGHSGTLLVHGTEHHLPLVKTLSARSYQTG